MYNPVGSPTEFIAKFTVLAPVSVATSASLDIDSYINMSKYEFMLIVMTMGVSDTVPTLTLKDNPDSAAGTSTAITNATLTLAADDDNKSISYELRTHGQDKFLDMNLTCSAAGSGGFISIVAYGIGPRRSGDINNTIGSEVSAIGMS